jgi:hypothetical protein
MHWISGQIWQRKWRGCGGWEGRCLALRDKKPNKNPLSLFIKPDMWRVLLRIAGPLSNLAYALDQRPEVAAKVARVWWMGGALQVPGNVYEPQSDGSAEWNAFWVSVVQHSHVPQTVALHWLLETCKA